MRHRKRGRQLGRQTKHRWALFRSLVTSLLEHDRIETTDAKAKEIRSFTDRMITLGKEGTLAARRRALTFLRQKAIVSKLFDDTALRFSDRAGGYTRITKTRRRAGDGAEMVAIELVVQASAAAAKADEPKSAPKDAEPVQAKDGEKSKSKAKAKASEKPKSDKGAGKKAASESSKPKSKAKAKAGAESSATTS